MSGAQAGSVAISTYIVGNDEPPDARPTGASRAGRSSPAHRYAISGCAILASRLSRWLIHPVDVEADTSTQAEAPERAMPGVQAGSVAPSTYIVGDDEPPAERPTGACRAGRSWPAHRYATSGCAVLARRLCRWLIHPVDGEADTSREAEARERAISSAQAGSVAISIYIVGDDEPPAERPTGASRAGRSLPAHRCATSGCAVRARRLCRWLIHPVDGKADTGRQAQIRERASSSAQAGSVAFSTYIVGDDEPPAERRPAQRVHSPKTNHPFPAEPTLFAEEAPPAV